MTDRRPLPYYLSRGVSYLLHPFLLPAYLMLLLFGTGIVPLYFTGNQTLYLFGVVGIYTAVIPLMSVLLLKVFGVIRDYSLSTRRDRIIPLFIVTLCYAACGWMLNDITAAFLLKRCMFAAAACSLFAFAVNFKWQVSLHMTAMGAAVGVIFIFLYGGFPSLVWIFCGAILASGALASARLYLGRHDMAQVVTGFFAGLCISILVMLLWK